MFCVCSTEDEVGEEYRADHEIMLADLLPKADIATVGLCEEERSKPFAEDLHETPEERARLEAEKDEILRQLSVSKDVDFDLSRARKIETIGDQTVYVEDCGIDFDALLEAREMEQQTKVYVRESVLDDLRRFLQLQDPEVNSKPKKTVSA